MSKKLKLDNLPVTPRGRTKQQKTEQAVQLRLRALNGTSDAKINDLEYWLFQGGYTEEDKQTMGKDEWSLLKNNFSAIFNNRKKATYEPPEDQKPIWERKVTHNFFRIVQVPTRITDLYDPIIAYVNNLEDDKVLDLSGVNLQQIHVASFFNQVAEKITRPRTVRGLTYMNLFVDFFKYHKLHEIGIEMDNLLPSVMRNKDDNFEFQDAHQDYFPIAISTEEEDEKPRINDNVWMAWSAIFPMSSKGSWLTVWFDQMNPYSFRLEYGQAVFFRSDVVHCGGRPRTDNITGEMFYRLHFYLQTKHQKAPNDKINKMYLDGRIPFSSLYTMTPEKLKQLEAEALERKNKASVAKGKKNN
jgi:hypothetical protein